MATWSRPRSIATIDLAPRDLRTNLRRRQRRQERYTKEMSAGPRCVTRRVVGTADVRLPDAPLAKRNVPPLVRYERAPRDLLCSALTDRVSYPIYFIWTVRFTAAFYWDAHGVVSKTISNRSTLW